MTPPIDHDEATRIANMFSCAGCVSQDALVKMRYALSVAYLALRDENEKLKTEVARLLEEWP